MADLEVEHRPLPVVAHRTDALASAHVLANLDVDLVEVAADRVVVAAVVEDDDAPVRAVAVREGDASGERGAHDGPGRRVDLEAGSVRPVALGGTNVGPTDDGEQ